MPNYSLRHPALVVGVVAALGTATIAPVAAAASAPKPAPVVQTQDLGGLLSGILGSVGGLTGSVASMVDQLVAGTLPGVLPAGTVSSLVTAVTSASTTAVTEIVDLLSPAQILQLVQQGPVAASSQLLEGLLASVTKLTGSLIAGTAQLPVVGTAFDRFTAILAGGIPTGAEAIKTFIGVLDQITTQLGLPNVASLPAVGPLITKLIGIAGQISDPAAITAMIGTVTAAAKGLGLDSSKLAALGTLGAAAPVVAATVARARLGSMAVGANRRTVRFKVVCPTTAPATGCVVKPSVKLAGSAAKLAKSFTVARGTTQTLSAAIPAGIAKKVRKSGGKLVVKVATTGATAGAITKTIAVPAG